MFGKREKGRCILGKEEGEICVGKREREMMHSFLTHLSNVTANVSLNSTSAECATSSNNRFVMGNRLT